jgi:hypothetical protein
MGTSGYDLGKQAAQERLQQQNQIQAQQRLQKQNTVGAQLLDAINQSSNIKPQIKDPNTGELIDNPAYAQAQEDRRTLLSQYAALNSPEQHATFAQHLHGLIFGKPTPHTQQPALSPNSSPNAPDDTTTPVAPPTPAPAAPLHPMAPVPPEHPLHAITKGISALGEHLKAAAHPLPDQPQPDAALISKYYRDPKEVDFERQKELWGVRGENALAVAQERTKALMASLSARPPRMLSQVTIPNLLDQLKVDPDEVIYGPNGQEISPAQLAEMPPGTIARQFKAGPNVFYALGDQNSKTANIGGKIFDIPAVGPITAANSTELGTATGALAKTHEVPGMNPGEKIQLTTKPAETPGMTAPPVAPTAAPLQNPSAVPQAPEGEPPNPVLKTRSTTTPVLPPSPSQKAVVDNLNAGRSKSKQVPQPAGMPMPPAFAPGTMLAQGRSAQPVVSAMSVMAANVFGGNGEPPIWEYAKMYDDPKIRQALNNALTLNALANPGTEDNPSFMQNLATAVGATKWTQEQINQANVAARQELERLGGPDALKMFSREAALQEDLSALRTATKASAAQGSIRTLVRAAPVYNVSSAQDFRNQLGATLNTATASMRGYPAINPEYMKWWERGVSAAKQGPASKNAPTSPTPARPANVPEGYVFKENGPKGKGWYAPSK